MIVSERNKKRLITIALFSPLSLLLCLSVFPTDIWTRIAQNSSPARVCQENLYKIDGAKEQYALEHNLAEDAKVSMSDLIGPQAYIRQTPICPSGGTYTVNVMGTDPTCSIGSEHSFAGVTCRECQANLGKLDGAKEQYALENNLPAGTNVTMDDLVGPVDKSKPNGPWKVLRKAPICPGGGTYTLNPIGTEPTCSIGGTHSLDPIYARYCQNNLAKLDAAKKKYALEKKLETGGKITNDDLVGPGNYLERTPSCPKRGTYTLNPIGTAPTCSIGGSHSLSAIK